MRVATETVRWREGELIVFDDSFEHEVWNESGETRIVLIVDFNHPDLPEKERKRQEDNLEVVGWEEDGPKYVIRGQEWEEGGKTTKSEEEEERKVDVTVSPSSLILCLGVLVLVVLVVARLGGKGKGDGGRARKKKQ